MQPNKALEELICTHRNDMKTLNRLTPLIALLPPGQTLDLAAFVAKSELTVDEIANYLTLWGYMKGQHVQRYLSALLPNVSSRYALLMKTIIHRRLQQEERHQTLAVWADKTLKNFDGVRKNPLLTPLERDELEWLLQRLAASEAATPKK